MDDDSKKHGSLDEKPVIYTYFNFKMFGPEKCSIKIPGWLWKKKVTNSVTNNSSPKQRVPSFPLFEEKSVDISTFFEDMLRIGYKPFHIHLMRRTHGGVRVRVSWLENPLETLSEEEMSWVRTMFTDFVYDVKSHRFYEATEHLPPHLNLSLGHMVERSNATCVHSVQVFDGEVSLINDPDAQVSREQHAMGERRLKGLEALQKISA